jgi:hypothetical protein
MVEQSRNVIPSTSASHNNYFMVTQFSIFKALLSQLYQLLHQCGKYVTNLSFSNTLWCIAFFIQNLTNAKANCLKCSRSRPCLAVPPAEFPRQGILAFCRILLWTIRKFSWQSTTTHYSFRCTISRAFLAAWRLSSKNNFLNYDSCIVWFSSK